MARLGRSIGRCNALNDEEEFDYYDEVAMTGARASFTANSVANAVRVSQAGAGADSGGVLDSVIERHDDGMSLASMDKSTEVLDDNVFERQLRMRLEGVSADVSADVSAGVNAGVSANEDVDRDAGRDEDGGRDEDAGDNQDGGEEKGKQEGGGTAPDNNHHDNAKAAAANPAASATAAADSAAAATAVAPSRGTGVDLRARGRLGEASASYVPPAKRQRAGGGGNRPIVAWSPSVIDVARPSGVAGRGGGGGRGGRIGNSWVPDHVKNPHKYTCYVLDEPLVVGGGMSVGTGLGGSGGGARGREEDEGGDAHAEQARDVRSGAGGVSGRPSQILEPLTIPPAMEPAEKPVFQLSSSAAARIEAKKQKAKDQPPPPSGSGGSDSGVGSAKVALTHDDDEEDDTVREGVARNEFESEGGGFRRGGGGSRGNKRKFRSKAHTDAQE